jgi:hypothetical protein
MASSDFELLVPIVKQPFRKGSVQRPVLTVAAVQALDRE